MRGVLGAFPLGLATFAEVFLLFAVTVALSPPQPESGAGYAITPSDSFRARAYVAAPGCHALLVNGATPQPDLRGVCPDSAYDKAFNIIFVYYVTLLSVMAVAGCVGWIGFAAMANRGNTPNTVCVGDLASKV